MGLDVFAGIDSIGGGMLSGALNALMSSLAGVLVPVIIVLLLVLGATYTLNGFQNLHIGRKAGLDKDWMPFVPFAHAIYRLKMVGEQWWKMFFLENWWLYAFVVDKIIMAISKNNWATFSMIITILYLGCCLAYNIYYRYKFYKAFNIQPVLSLLVVTTFVNPAMRIIDLLIAFTDNYAYSGSDIKRTISGTARSVVNVPQRQAAAGAQAGSVTGLSGMYAGQDLPMAAGEEMVIGRDSALVNLIVDKNADKVSRKHCGIVFSPSTNSYVVTDYSTNGTFVDGGNRLVANMPTTLPRGTVIALGSRENRFKLN